MKNYKKIVDRYSCISFDIFDTLVQRKVDTPSDVFYLTGMKIFGNEQEAINFKTNRIKAEEMARKLRGEISIEDIYELLKENYSHKTAQLYEQEVKTEIEVCNPIELMLEVVDYALKQDKTVILISDMYLKHSTIEEILNKCDVKGYLKLYVSCECGCNKLSGKLFNRVLAENNISCENMVHFGDSIKADYIGAKKAGIRGYLVHRKNRLSRIFKRWIG